MSLIILPYIFSGGTTIVASQTNSNNTTFLNAINGGLDNTNLTGTAGITYANLSLGGNIVDADINAAAEIATSKINFGTADQGDIFVDKGSGITRLTPGTSGQFLQTQGTSANPQWATIGSSSNVLFQYQGQIEQEGTLLGEVTPASLNPTNPIGTYRFIAVPSNSGNYTQMWTSKFEKIVGISTVTIYARMWNKTTAGGTPCNIKVDVGGQNQNVNGTNDQTTPEWVTFTIDVSSLTNGTAYDVTASMKSNGSGGSFCANIIGLGS